MTYDEHKPAWRIATELRREARESIDGRASFEKHFGRPSAKPLRRVDIDPRDLLKLLDELEAEPEKAWAAGAEAQRYTSDDLTADPAYNPYKKKDWTP